MSVPSEHVGVTLALPLINIIHVISKPPSQFGLYTKNGGWLVLLYPKYHLFISVGPNAPTSDHAHSHAKRHNEHEDRVHDLLLHDE